MPQINEISWMNLSFLFMLSIVFFVISLNFTYMGTNFYNKMKKNLKQISIMI